MVGLIASDSHVLFLDFEEFWRKSQKGGKLEKSWQIGLLRCSVGNPRRGVDLRQGVGTLAVARPGSQKWHPSGTPRHSFATPRRRAMLQRSSATL